MKTFVFPYYISFGKLDSVSCEIELSISDKDAKRIVKSAKEGGRFRLNEDETLSDLYDRVFKRILQAEKETLLSDPSTVKDFLSWEAGYDDELPITEKQIDNYLDNLEIGINYPEALQLLEVTTPKKNKQTNCESIIIDRSIAQEYVYMEKNRNKIVFIDEGETLYFIPSDYSGTFTIDASVKKLEGGPVSNPFKNRKKIIEVIIENGLTEIPDWAFEGCDSLERIVIPKSVRKIGFNAFTKCSRLKRVEMSEGLLELHNTAFRFCYDLEELHIPASVEEISMHIASYSSGIKRIFFEGLETSIDDTLCRGDEWDKVTIYVKSGSTVEFYAKEHGIKYEIYDN